MDGDVDYTDVGFVLLAVAQKYRFLAPADSSGALLGIAVDGCDLTVTAVLRDDANVPVASAAKTRVRLEVGMTANTGSVALTTGSALETTANGVAMEMALE